MKHTVRIRAEIPCGLKRAIEYLQGLLDKLPEEHREHATLDLDIEGEGWGDFNVSYYRDATPQEVEERRSQIQLQAAQWKKRQEALEKQLKELDL